MNLPMNGRVVIIDDSYEEVFPLIKILSQKRVAGTYFTGRIEELPEKPFEDVRIVFLDIVLEGLEGADEKTKISTLINVVTRIISKENGPFVLAIWTKHPEMTEKIQEKLKEEGFYIITVNLKKDAFFERKESGGGWKYKYANLKPLIEKIEKEMGTIDIFKLFIEWENLVHEAASLTVNEISKFVEHNDSWNAGMKKIFYNLAKAWAGKTIDEMGDDRKIRNALYSFSHIFADVFERRIQEINIEGISIESADIENEIKARINSRILLDTSTEGEFYPGNVYVKTRRNFRGSEFIQDIIDWDEFKLLKEKISSELSIGKSRFEKRFKSAIEKKVKPILLEITPQCDYVQSKMKKSRFVEGILCPDNLSFFVDSGNGKKLVRIKIINSLYTYKKESEEGMLLLKQKADYLYISPIIAWENKNYYLIFDFRYFTSTSIDETSRMRPIFRLRKEILTDIQIKLSHHINRTGVLYLG